MKNAIVEAARHTAEQAASKIDRSPGKTLLIEGPPGSGRSLVLELAAEILRAASFHPILIAPPERQVETASLALLDAAVGLFTEGSLSLHTLPWQTPGTWRERLDELRLWFKDADESGRLVLLVDDTRQWYIPEAGEIVARTSTVIDFLLHEVGCSRILVGTRSDHPYDELTEMDVVPGLALLDDGFGWGPLADIASELRSILPAVAAKPVAHISLVVAFAALTSMQDLLVWWTPRTTTEQVADRLASLVSTDKKFRTLWNAWLWAALPRRPIPREWFEPEIDRITSSVQRGVLEQVLLLGQGVVRLAREARAASWRIGEDSYMARTRDLATRRLCDAYLDQVDTAVRELQPSVLTSAAEALHLAARFGDTAMAFRAPVAFSDQMNSFGVAALERADWAVAASAFDLALEIDPDDAFARHYLGLSLDSDAVEPLRVEECYTRALDLESSHAAWHARLICFLIVRARMTDARERWEYSRARLMTEDGDGPVDLYARLHLPVAANALRRAELAMGYEILDDVPEWARNQLLAYSDQRHRLEVLESGHRLGSFLPAYRASADWWAQGPELLSDRHPDGRPLHTWLAAGVEATTEDGLDLSVAVVRGTGRPTVGTTTLTWKQLHDFTVDVARAQDLDVGDFIEVGYYAVGNELGTDPVIRVLPRIDWLAGIDTPLDPARYLRRSPWLPNFPS